MLSNNVPPWYNEAEFDEGLTESTYMQFRAIIDNGFKKKERRRLAELSAEARRY